MKNTVIANRKKGDWKIIKKYFEDRGVYTSGRSGGSREDTDGNTFYYGVINGKFDNWFIQDVEQANATILEVSDIDKEFKVGDVVVVTQNTNEQGKVTEITCRNTNNDRYFILKNCGLPYNSEQMRHATPEEINQYKGISDTVTLPKSFVLEAHKSACSDWKKRIEEVLPELFPKNELIVGKWYKKGDAISMFNGVGEHSYGIHSNGSWVDRHFWFGCSKSIERWQAATEQEVFDALKAEAVKRGFKEGVEYNCNGIRGRNDNVKCGNIETAKQSTFGSIGLFCTNNGWIYDSGKWATIIDKTPDDLKALIEKYGKEEILKLLKN